MTQDLCACTTRQSFDIFSFGTFWIQVSAREVYVRLCCAIVERRDTRLQCVQSKNNYFFVCHFRMEKPRTVETYKSGRREGLSWSFDHSFGTCVVYGMASMRRMTGNDMAVIYIGEESTSSVYGTFRDGIATEDIVATTVAETKVLENGMLELRFSEESDQSLVEKLLAAQRRLGTTDRKRKMVQSATLKLAAMQEEDKSRLCL